MSTVYRCLIVEDEPLAQNVLKKYIAEHPLLELVAVCGDAPEAQQWLARHPAAIVFSRYQPAPPVGHQLFKESVAPSAGDLYDGLS